VRSFKSLSEKEILALAISLEEEDARIYVDFADGVKDRDPALATELRQLGGVEDGHRHRLLELYRQKFGDHIPNMRRQHVKGFLHRDPVWLTKPVEPDVARKQVEMMEAETTQFYESALEQTTDVSVRQLLGDLAAEERAHQDLAGRMLAPKADGDDEAAKRRLFVLQVIQPGLAGLMDGSVSTLAPLFAAAFATQNSQDAFVVGLAASLGAGISMGFAEALSDDGSLTGRGRPLVRGAVCGVMTALGGLGHTLPYLIPDFRTATGVAMGVVVVELGAIAWIRRHFMGTPWASAVFQVVLGGTLVFLTGVLIGRWTGVHD
jgi:erythrin-vacuolar iron transport family protein